jgi:hypothetical protein
MDEWTKNRHPTREREEVEMRRSGVRGLLNWYRVLGIDLDRHRIQPSAGDSASFVGAQLHQTLGGADNPGEEGTQRSKVRVHGRLE